MVGALLDASDLLGERMDLRYVFSDCAQQRNRPAGQFGGLQNDVPHFAHSGLETRHLEQVDDLRSAAKETKTTFKVPKRGQASGSENGTLPNRDACQLEADRIVLRVPWKKSPSKRRREIIVPQSAAPQDARPIRAETRATLVASIARGRRWLDEIVAGSVSVDQIAAREKCSIRQVNMTISLAFLAPRLVQAAVEGRLPRGIGVARLRDAPAEWSRQYAMLGLSV